MSIPLLRVKNLNDGSGFRFQLLDHVTGLELFDGEWFSQEETERRCLEYAQGSIRTAIAVEVAEYHDGRRPTRRHH